MFFSSPVPRNLLNTIKSEASVLARVAVLREVKILLHHCFLLAFCVDQEA